MSKVHPAVRSPTAFVEAGDVETFRDESVDYASHIWQAGGPGRQAITRR